MSITVSERLEPVNTENKSALAESRNTTRVNNTELSLRSNATLVDYQGTTRRISVL